MSSNITAASVYEVYTVEFVYNEVQGILYISSL
jgi:hypothetical protein